MNPMLTGPERRELAGLVDAEIDRTLVRMKKRGQKPVVAMGVEVPIYRIAELRWQKIEFLLGIRAKCLAEAQS